MQRKDYEIVKRQNRRTRKATTVTVDRCFMESLFKVTPEKRAGLRTVKGVPKDAELVEVEISGDKVIFTFMTLEDVPSEADVKFGLEDEVE